MYRLDGEVSWVKAVISGHNSVAELSILLKQLTNKSPHNPICFLFFPSLTTFLHAEGWIHMVNDCHLWTEPCHFKYTWSSANMYIYLNRSAYPRDCCEESDWFRIQAFELSLISSKNNRLTTCAFVWRGRLVYASICDKSDCLGSTL